MVWTLLSLLRARVQSLVRELRSHRPHGVLGQKNWEKTNCESLYCIPVTYVISYINYTSIFFKSVKMWLQHFIFLLAKCEGFSFSISLSMLLFLYLFKPRVVIGRQEPSEKVPRLRLINSNSCHDEFRPGSTVTAFAEMNSLSPLISQADQSCCTSPAGEETETPSLCPRCPVT